jgi:anti-anti-sigma factor
MPTLQAQLTLIAEPPPPARARAALHDPESAAMWHHHLDIETGPAGSIAVLHLAGDIDMLTLPLLRAALFTALDTRPGDLVVDLSEVRFCGVRGFVVLAAMRQRPRAAESATPWPAWVPAATGPPRKPGPVSAFAATPTRRPRSSPPVARRPARALISHSSEARL